MKRNASGTLVSGARLSRWTLVLVALGEPGVPVVCCARALAPSASSKEAAASPRVTGRPLSGKCASIMGHLQIED